MRHKRFRLFALFLAALAALAIPSAPAQASTGGTPDTANEYSNVGLILFYDADGRFRCTATLVSPTVLITAAHCTQGQLGKTLVDFRPFISDDGVPAPYAPAKDPSKGYTAQEIQRMGFVSGTAYTHPQYSDFTDTDNWNDVGVIVLDKAIKNMKTSSIAEQGALDTIPYSDLSKTLFRAVGYGTEVRKPDSGPQKPQPMSYPLLRRYVDMPGQKLTPQILQTNGNENDNKGTGGTCFGDSGGPVFWQGKIVAVTSYGYTDNCRYLGGYQRVDIPVVQSWLAQFGVKP